MSEIGDDFKALNDHRRKERDAGLPARRAELCALSAKGYRVMPMDSSSFEAAFHFRINGVLDIWPSRNRFWFLKPEGGCTERRRKGSIYESESITAFVTRTVPLGGNQ